VSGRLHRHRDYGDQPQSASRIQADHCAGHPFGDDGVEAFGAVTADLGQQPRRLATSSPKNRSGVCSLWPSAA
jgi:hypothetical protein